MELTATILIVIGAVAILASAWIRGWVRGVDNVKMPSELE